MFALYYKLSCYLANKLRLQKKNVSGIALVPWRTVAEEIL